MRTFLQKHWFKVAAIAAIVAVAAVLAVRFEESDNIQWLNNPRPAADFTLTDQNGNTVRFQDGQGKVRLVYLFFSYCPDVCPESTYRLKDIQQTLNGKGL